jgi:hypothetical protein
MRHRILTLIAGAALLSAAGCGSDNDDGEHAATATTPAVGQATTMADATTATTEADSESAARGGRELSPEGRAVLAETQDLAGDVSQTAEDFAEGRIDDDEAKARLELAGERASDLRGRAQKLPAADRARARLASLNDEIGRTAAQVSKLATAGRTESRNEIAERIDALRDDARSTVDAASEQLDKPARERFRKALDEIGARTG